MNTSFDYSGNLYWYHHEGQLDGSPRWKGGLTDPVGIGGWEQYLSVFSAEDGIIYAIDSDGNLYWYKHLGWQDGTQQWTERKLVGNGGWQLYKSVFAGSEGVIYGIDVDGNLYWYHHFGWQDGSERWSQRQLVGDGGWQLYLSVFSAGNGIIYGVGADGNLYWYRHDGWRTGTKEWTGRNQVGNGGWQDFVSVSASDHKIIYAVGADGNLYWYRHDGQQDGTPHWAERTLVGVGGWLVFKCVCVAPGGIIYGVGLDRQSWMSPFRNKFIHELIIPGTHDSGTAGFPSISLSRTQYYKIDEQLQDGVRFLDMRLAYNSVEENFHVVHGTDVASNLNFDTVVKWCADFLAAHPSETILMSIKQEGLLPGSDDAFARELSKWNAAFVTKSTWKSDLWFTTNEMPRVADAKGKIVLLRRYTVPKSVVNPPLFFGGLDLSYINSSQIGTFPLTNVNDPAKSKPFSSVLCNFQDEFEQEGLTKKNSINSFLWNMGYFNASNTDYYWNLNFASTAKPTPYRAANDINPWLQSELKLVKYSIYGVLLTDFADQSLWSQIYQMNFPK